ncbi:MAG TPA: MerR family transcriptional regulator [Kofleriaceae bacterium]|nr:MerR family transcriptional regulator [Kofleriaceae bacterium]
MKPPATNTPGDRAVEVSRSRSGSDSKLPTQAPVARAAPPQHVPAAGLSSRRAARVDRDQLGGLTPKGEVVGLTRAGAAALLRVSSSTIRRLEERGELHPHVVDGVHFFDPEEIHRARAARASSAPPDGDAAALAFELLDQGMGLRDIVKRCRVTPERARVLATEWKKMGSGELVISAEVRAEISRTLGGVHLPSASAILRAVRDVVQERDGLEREFADMQEERNAAEDLLAPEQLRKLYAARVRARAASADPP